MKWQKPLNYCGFSVFFLIIQVQNSISTTQKWSYTMQMMQEFLPERFPVVTIFPLVIMYVHYKNISPVGSVQDPSSPGVSRSLNTEDQITSVIPAKARK